MWRYGYSHDDLVWRFVLRLIEIIARHYFPPRRQARRRKAERSIRF